MNTEIPNWIRSRFAGLSAAVLAVSSASSMGQVTNTDLELSLVIDVSGSVDANEYSLQLDGYAAAFRNPTIQSAIGAGPNGSIAVNALFFDSQAYPGLDWTLLSSPADANAFADALAAFARPGSGGTSPHLGVNAATDAITTNNFEGTRKVIDVSGDGQGSVGSDQAARDAALAAGVNAINGLPINLAPGNTSIEDYYRANIVGGQGSFTEAADSFSDFERAILAKLRREILGEAPDNRQLLNGLRPVALALSRTMTRDVGGRLMQLRAGGPGELKTSTSQPIVSSGAKGGVEVVPGTTTVLDRWHVWGDVYAYTQDFDRQTARTAAGGALVIAPQTDLDIIGGSVGFDYRLNQNLTVGLALGAADGDADFKGVADVDIESISIMPYLAYYRSQAVGAADVWADLHYAYTDTEYDVRIGGAKQNFDGKSHQLEFNTGLNYRTGNLIHGPFLQLRYSDGEVDSGIDFDSFATQLGYQVSHPISLGAGTLIPQARLAWEHEFEADQGSIAGLQLGEVDEDIFVGGLGLIYAMNTGWQFGLDYEARLGDQSESHYVGARAGFRF